MREDFKLRPQLAQALGHVGIVFLHILPGVPYFPLHVFELPEKPASCREVMSSPE